jgi:hypothetical protein
VKPSRPLLGAALLLLAACRPSPDGKARVIYAPHEEGLTLAYENPSLEGSARMESRRQVRVDSVQPAAGGNLLTGEMRHTRLTGEDRFHFEIRDGGLKVSDDQKHTATILPEGFPDRVSAWVEGGVRTRVLGRATVPGFDRLLPAGASKVGIWIESAPESGEGPRTRAFLLPDIGTAEALEWKEGRWTASRRLVSFGFTDSPKRPAPAVAPVGKKR